MYQIALFLNEYRKIISILNRKRKVKLSNLPNGKTYISKKLKS